MSQELKIQRMEESDLVQIQRLYEELLAPSRIATTIVCLWQKAAAAYGGPLLELFVRRWTRPFL